MAYNQALVLAGGFVHIPILISVLKFIDSKNRKPSSSSQKTSISTVPKIADEVKMENQEPPKNVEPNVPEIKEVSVEDPTVDDKNIES